MLFTINDKPIDYHRGRIDSFDIVKPLLCLLVVIQHINPLPKRFATLITPFTRIGVPLFFLMSGFLFFRKYDSLTSAEAKRSMFIKYAKRILSMYFFWMLVFFGPTMEKRWWFHDGILQGIPKFFHSLVFGSTFIASWYLMSTILGLALVLLLGRFLSDRLSMAIGTLLYACTCVFSVHAYLGVLPGIGALNNFWQVVRINPCNSIPVGFFWMQMSRIMAKNVDDYLDWFRRSGLLPFVCVVLSFLLCIEHRFGRTIAPPTYDDCFFMLIPLAPVLFLGALEMRITSPHAAILRKWSSLTYLTHGSIGFVLAKLNDHYGIGMHNYHRFILTLVLCTLILALFERLARSPRFAWLKNVY